MYHLRSRTGATVFSSPLVGRSQPKKITHILVLSTRLKTLPVVSMLFSQWRKTAQFNSNQACRTFAGRTHDLAMLFGKSFLSFVSPIFCRSLIFWFTLIPFRALWNHNALHLKKSSALLIAEWLRHPVYHSGWTTNFHLQCARSM